MNQRQKDFILKKLIPFISREHGRGFAMATWKTSDLEPGSRGCLDDVVRTIPVCGTVACIGGSVQILKNIGGARFSDFGMGYTRALGLTLDQVKGLFYSWEVGGDHDYTCSWPEKFARQFEKARTPYGKSQVAVRLLKEVVRTEGACLNLPSQK